MTSHQPNLNRRSFLKVSGAVLIVAAGSSVWRAADQGIFSAGTGRAYEPWKNWRNASTATERIVAAGILASNPHNSQPWIFHSTSSAIDLYADFERQIGVIDPFRREMHIGLGCAIENMVLAAAAEGLQAEVHLLPNPGVSSHIAHLELSAAAPQSSALYTAIPNRHTNRGPYDTTRPVPSESFTSIEQLVNEATVRLFWFIDMAGRTKFSQAAEAACEALIADEQQSLDSHAWWRQDWSMVQQHADGITLDAQGLGPILTNLAKFLPDGSRQQNDQIFVKNMRQMILPTAAAFGILAVRDGMDNTQHLECGRAWQRIHLWGTTQGLAFQPLNQMCERADRERQLNSQPILNQAVRELVGDDSWQAVMPFRIGYPTQAAHPSPRRRLEEVMPHTES